MAAQIIPALRRNKKKVNTVASLIYWVKQERRLFGKPEWKVSLGNILIALANNRDEAIEEALREAERTSILGRQSEVWIDDGHGFTLNKAFQPVKPSKKDDDEGDEDDGEEDSSADDTALMASISDD